MHHPHRWARALVAALSLAVAAGVLAAPASATSFADVPATHPFVDEIGYVSDQGIMTGYPNGTFRPTNHVTREAMAVFLYRQAGSPAFTPPASADRSFVDVRTTHRFYAEIEWAASEGIVSGWPTDYIDPETGPLPEFRPGAELTRQSVAVQLYRAAGSPAYDPPDHWSFIDVFGPVSYPDSPAHPFFLQIEWANAGGLMHGRIPNPCHSVDYCDPRFTPRGVVTRGSLAAILARFDQQFPAP